MQTFTSPRARLSAALTGQGKEVSPERALERAATDLTRRIVQLQAKQRKLRAALKQSAAAIKAAKRELRTLLQRSSTIEYDSLELAGQADGADRAIALAEQPRRGQHLLSCQWLGETWFCAADCPLHRIVDLDAEKGGVL